MKGREIEIFGFEHSRKYYSSTELDALSNALKMYEDNQTIACEVPLDFFERAAWIDKKFGDRNYANRVQKVLPEYIIYQHCVDKGLKFEPLIDTKSFWSRLERVEKLYSRSKKHKAVLLRMNYGIRESRWEPRIAVSDVVFVATPHVEGVEYLVRKGDNFPKVVHTTKWDQDHMNEARLARGLYIKDKESKSNT
jgi:hypothetical protein